MTTSLSWLVLTMGDRPDALRAAVASLDPTRHDVTVVVNGADPGAVDEPDVRLVATPTNLGIPGGRDHGLRLTDGAVVGFLDDDARVLSTEATDAVVAAFEQDPALGAVSFRIVDDQGTTARRHVPRFGSGSPDRGGAVGTFLGGACAIRRTAYEAAGGYWPELFYAHEELDLSWRLHDAGYGVAYLADVVVEHPRLPISRHADGWRRTGRNRVMIARRNLPFGLHLVHAVAWLAIGAVRAPTRDARSAYVGGWTAGWREDVRRRPIHWSTVRRLTRVGRPPIL